MHALVWQGVDIRAQLLRFHKELYSANLMRLCIIGRDSLDVMEGWVRRMFSGIQDLDVSPDRSWTQLKAFGEEWRGMSVLVPVKERRKLSLMFQSAPVEPEYRSKPQQVIALRILAFWILQEVPG